MGTCGKKPPDVPDKMAAPCRILVRSVIEAGLRCFSGVSLHSKVAGERSCTRALHCSSSCFLSSSKTSEDEKDRNDGGEKGERDGGEDSGPEYIPKRKAKNPMKVIGYAWIIGLPAGIIGFVLAKKQVDRNRLQQLKIRQRMKKSNEGEYERDRYRPAAGIQ